VPDPFILDGWLVEPDLNTLSRDGTRVRLEPKVMELCVALTRAAGSVVTKDELLESVWPEAIVGEDALTRAMSELRRGLGDDARNPRVIETIPKRGYRLIAQVRAVGVVEPPPTKPLQRRHRSWLLAAAGLVVVTTIALVAVWGTRIVPTPTDTDRRPLVLLADVEHGAAVPASAIESVRRSIEREIARRPDVEIVPQHEIDAALRRMRRHVGDPVTPSVAVELAIRLGEVAGVVAPRLDPAGDGFTLTIQTVDVTGKQVLEATVSRGEDEGRVLAAFERVSADWSRRLAGLRPPAAKRLPAVTTSSIAALRFFTQAVELLATVPIAAQAAPWPDAAELLRKAIAVDDEFVLARVWLALAQKSSEDARLSAAGGRRVAGFREMASECLAKTQDLGEAERLLVEGVAYELLDEHSKAISALEALLWTDPGFFELQARASLYRLYTFQTRWSEADAQVLRIAEIVPHDFDATVLAAQVLVLQDGDARRASGYIARARQLMAGADTNRENSSWLKAWLEHYPAYDAWKRGDLAEALAVQRAVAATLPTRIFIDRDATATANGHLSLTLGRIADARQAFDAIGHFNQKEWSFAHLADALGDRRQLAWHLTRHGRWSWNPLPFARAGLFDRVRELLAEPAVGADHVALRKAALGEEALAAGRFSDAITHFQDALDRLRMRPGHPYYGTSISLARAWRAIGDDTQVVRVLEEAVRTQAYPGAAVFWIKAQAHLVQVYRRHGRHDEAAAIAERVRGLFAHADADHPFWRLLQADPPTDAF
jgi:DNA-binding winged helix-turn-helix (wHTH) protein/tetratricopeptide (TPR) repeat protein